MVTPEAHARPEAPRLPDPAANFSALIESTDDPIWSVDLDFRLLVFNRALSQAVERQFGSPATVGLKLEEVVPPEKVAFWSSLYRRALTEGAFRTEYTTIRGRTLELSLNPIVQNGQTTGISAFGKDITGWKRDKAALHAEKERFRNIVRDAAAGYFRIGADGCYQDVNPAWLKMYGLSQLDQVLGRHFSDIDKPEDLPKAGEFEAAILRGESVVNGEFSRLRPDGTFGHYFFSEHPILDGTRIVAVEGFTVDITERKRAEDALRKSEEKFAKLFSCSPAAVSISDLDNLDRLIEVNEAFEHTSGYRREELIGRTTQELGLWQHRNEFEEAVRRVRSRNGLRNFEFQFRRKDGTVRTGLISAVLIEMDGTRVAIAATIDITARKAAEKALEEAKRKYQDILEGALIGIFRSSRQGELLAANPFFANMLGYDSAEEAVAAINDSARQVWVDAAERARLNRQLELDGAVQNFECQFKRKDGSAIWVSLTVRTEDESGEGPRVLQGFVKDISERKQSEDALRRSEARFRAVVENSYDGILFGDANQLILYRSPSWPSINGYSDEERLGKTGIETVHPDDVTRIGAAWARLIKHPGMLLKETYRIRHKNGSWRWVETRCQNLLGNPNVAAVVAHTRDVTEQKRAEEALREANQFSQQVIDSAREGIAVYDRDLRLRAWNPFMEEMTGIPARDVLGGHARDVLSFLKESGAIEGLERALAGEAPKLHEFRFSIPGTGRHCWVSTLRSPLRNAKGEIVGAIAAVREITAQKRAEAEQAELREQFLQAQKLESVGRLAGGIAHDFNNLLLVINGYASLIAQKLDRDGPLRSQIDEIRNAGERAASLTKQLLAFSRKQIIEPKLLDLNVRISEFSRILQRLIGEDIRLTLSLDPALGRVMADPEQIDQVIMNLAVNARDAMPGGGALNIDTANTHVCRIDAPNRHIPTGAAYVRITVSDTGTGIGEDILPQIFDPFFTTKERGKGTGLGLSTVYGIVQQSGGWIEVSSQRGAGSSFSIFLPQVEQAAIEVPSGASASVGVHGRETILLVEDQRAVRLLTKSMLEANGYNVLEAANAEVAVEIARNHTERIHLLLTDVVLPDSNGKDLAGRLSAARSELKVLFMSGFPADVIAHHGVLNEGVDYIAKPFTAHALAGKVRAVLKPKGASAT